VTNAGETSGLAELERQFLVMEELLEIAAHKAMVDVAKLLQEYAKAHHPWQNQSGKTEQTTIGTEVDVFSQNMVYALLSAGMPYDVFLETYFEGRWAWLHQAVIDNRMAIQAILGASMQKALGELKVAT
jgi:hypothetical protein